MKIWLLAIEHRHGTDHWACATEEVALAHLDAYIEEWWTQEVGDEPIPEDRVDRIIRYFERQDDNWAMVASVTPECYSIEELTVHEQVIETKGQAQ